MPGFFCVIDYSLSKKFLDVSAFKNSLECKAENFKAVAYSDSIDKFEDDKLFYQDEDLIIVLEGVIFNKRELMDKSDFKEWIDVVKELYGKNQDAFHKVFRGSYSGFIYDKKKEEWNFFTDPIGDKQVFVYEQDNLILIGSDIKHFLTCLKLNNRTISLDETAAYMLLSYGFFLEDYTLFKEIRKLNAGQFLSIQDQKIKRKTYHRFSNEPNYELGSERDIIEGIDQRFRTAVKRQFDKDKEYGYKHIAGLSGGLDSRMTVWVAHELGYTNQLNFTFSQTNYLDETIAKKIATDLKHEWLFKALDNGTFLIDQLESVIDINYGGALYYGLAHGKSLIDNIDFSNLGVIHTGQIESLSAAGYKNLSEYEKVGYDVVTGSHSQKLINRIVGRALEKIESKYSNKELFLIYTRYFNGIQQGGIPGQQKTETFSPFCDLDFMSFCLSIPTDKRISHNLYKKWIQEKYPKAAEYIWENIGASINAPTIKIKGREFTNKQLKRAVKNKLLTPVIGDKAKRTATKNHMNPLDYWYNTNSDLKAYMDAYYESSLSFFDTYPDLKKDLKMLYKQGNTVEKNQVLTLLAACKLFFQE